MVLIGDQNVNRLHRYDSDEEMYESCDHVIEMIDSGYWEIFSKDQTLIARLAAKFKHTECLDTDFLTQESNIPDQLG